MRRRTVHAGNQVRLEVGFYLGLCQKSSTRGFLGGVGLKLVCFGDISRVIPVRVNKCPYFLIKNKISLAVARSLAYVCFVRLRIRASSDLLIIGSGEETDSSINTYAPCCQSLLLNLTRTPITLNM